MSTTEVQIEELDSLDTRRFSEFYVVKRDGTSYPSLVHNWPQLAGFSNPLAEGVVRDAARLHVLVDDPEDRATIDAILKRVTQ